ncbi:MAG TPA: hypothetical protein VFE62_21860 [Gemmataceae bacterium]|nr:hypothetical protein [Gemmataceae bacterium]
MRHLFLACVIGLLLVGPAFTQPAKKSRTDALGDPLPAQALHRFGTARMMTQAEVGSLSTTHDGGLIAAADRDGRIYLWDSATGKERLRTRPDSGKRVALSPDGAWLALGDEAPFELRNLKKDEPPRFPIGNGPKCFVFTHDSKSIILSQMDEADIIQFDIASGKETRRFAGLGAATTIALSPDGKRLAAGLAPPMTEEEDVKPSVRIVVWDAVKGDKLKDITQPGKLIDNLGFLADNKTLIAQIGARLAAFDSSTGAPLKKPSKLGSFFALDTSGKWLACADGPQVIEAATGKVTHEFESSTFLRNVVLSGDGKLLMASPARLESASPRILVWDLKADKQRSYGDVHRHTVEAVAFSHDGRWIATASNVEGRARVWDAQTAKLLHTLNIDSLAAKKSGGPRIRRTLADGLAFAIGRPELFVVGQRWDLEQGKPIPSMGDDDFQFEQTNSSRAVMSPDARRAASFLSGHDILLWDPAKAKEIKRIDPNEKKRRSDWAALAFSPDDRFVALGKWFPPIKDEPEEPLDDTIHLWDIAAGKRIKALRPAPTPVLRLMFSPDGETLAVVGYPTRLELWHLPSGRRLREMNLGDIDELPKSFSLPTVAFAPHGQWFAFTHQEGEILLLETQTGKEIQRLRGHEGFVSSLAFSPDSRRLLSGGRDTTALLWSIIPANPELPASWKDADKLWLELGGAPPAAYKIVWALMAHPDCAVEVLAKRLTKDTGASDKEIRMLVADLASEKFKERAAAMRRLKEIGTRSFPALEDALKKAPDLETTRRIQELLRTVQTSLTPETLRDLRGMQVLEMIATPEARKVLAVVAAGDAGAAKTRLARAALARMGK